jgi:mortality factor 4-like protein 1
VLFLSLKEPLIVIQTVVDGFQAYFDRALGANLLYRFERPQYAEVRKNYWTGPKVVIGNEKEMSHVYGAEHLLRMLGELKSYFILMVLRADLVVDSVSLPQIISTTAMDAESVNIIRDYANELMVYVCFPLL